MTLHVCPLVVVEMNFAATIPGSYQKNKEFEKCVKKCLAQIKRGEDLILKCLKHEIIVT